MNHFLIRLILVLSLAIASQISSFACAGGGYTQLLPIAKNEKGDLWVLKMSLGREGRGEVCEYNTKLLLYNPLFQLIDSMDLAKGERKVEIGDKAMPLTQFESLADSLYNAAVNSLKKHYNDLTFLTFNGAKVAVSDTLGSLQIIRNEVVESYYDTSNFRGQTTINLINDTFQNISALKYNGTYYHLDDLANIQADNGDFMGWSWQRISVHGAKFYTSGEEVYIVLHFEIMSPYSNWDMKYSTISQSTKSWNTQMYHPIGWHHNGQEILFRLE